MRYKALLSYPINATSLFYIDKNLSPTALTSLSAASSRLAAWAEAVMVEATRLSITRAVPEIRVPLVTVSTLPRPT